MKIPVFNPTIRRKDLDAVLTCMVDGKLGGGESVDALIAIVSEKLGHSGGIAVRDPGKGIGLLFRLLCAQEGKREIAVSALAPAWYGDPSALKEADLKLCDVDVKTALLSPESVSERLSEATAAVILTDTLGTVADAPDFAAFKLPLIRDVSASFGLTAVDTEQEGGRLLGEDVDYCLLSLEPESMVTGGGGLIITAKSRAQAAKLKRLLSEYSEQTVLSDLNASLAHIQVQTSETALRRRKEIFSIYMAAFAQSRKETLSFSHLSDGFYYAFPVLVDVDAAEIIKYASKKGVEIRFAFEKSLLSLFDERACPGALNLKTRCLIFPLYPMLSLEDCKVISRLITTVA